ncbi:MAG TPA: hypothetical protein VHZ97_18530 [Pseudonocardiaceae bacterium]|jgi:hypothetical protein|nr:hypothetical protein [Pseudonocardiaceae bacterium]
MLTKIRRRFTGLAVAGLLAGGALAIAATPASASPQDDDVIAGPFDNSVLCWNEYYSIDAGTEWPNSGCVFGGRNGLLGWWLISDAGVST